jgi:hypothetical protein
MIQTLSPTKRRLGLIVGIVVLVPIVLFALWAWITLSWAYSEGDRGGVLQKFSRKGWVCKTYEGEVAQYVVRGMAPQIWYFTTRDDALAERLSKAVGQNIRLQYTEHRGVPTSCFGDTRYFATGFVVVNEPPAK